MKWIVETYGPVVDAEILALPAEMRRKLFRIFDRIGDVGLEGLPRPVVRHLEGSYGN